MPIKNKPFVSPFEQFITSFDPPLPEAVLKKLRSQNQSIDVLVEKIGKLENEIEEFSERLEASRQSGYQEAEKDFNRRFGLNNPYIESFLTGYVNQQDEINARLVHLEQEAKRAVKKPYEYGDDY